MVTLSMLAVVAHYPDLSDDELDPVLPTPLSEIDDDSLPNLRLNGVSSDFIGQQAPLPHGYRTIGTINQRRCFHVRLVISV